MKAVVMAGGEGSRLRPLTILRPKPMVQLVNKPVMEHALNLLKRHGITEVIVTVQYLASVIQDYFGDGSQLGMKLSYAVEETPLGTAGSVKQAASLHGLDDTFLVISADALTDFDLGAILEFHKNRGATATLTLYSVPNPLEYGVVIIDADGRIRQFLEKPSWGEVFSDTVNTGIYVLEPKVLDYIPTGKVVDFSQDVFPQLLANNDNLFGFVSTGYWCDVGNITEYMRANADILHGRVNVGPIGTEISPGVWAEGDVEVAPDAQIYGPVFLGEGVKVKGGAIVSGPTVLRDLVIVDTRAQVDRAIVWRNTYIGERAEVRGAIVCRQCSIRARAMVFEGAVVGDQTGVGEGAMIQPGVKIWPDKEIEAGAIIRTSLIWGSQGRRTLFSRWGVSGLVNIDMTPEFAARFATAYGSTLAKGASVIVNRDYHRSPRMIKRAIVSGLPSVGINALDIKSQPIPVVRYVTRHSGAAGGIHVRLSPYDARVVDVKLLDKDGLDLDRKTERKIENLYFREDVRRVYLDEVGLIEEQPQLVASYSTDFVKALGDTQEVDTNRTIVIDYAHSPAALVLQPILNRFRWRVVALNSEDDERRLSVTPDEFEAMLDQLAVITSSLRATFGVRLDIGGEKLFVVDDRGRRVDGWRLFAAVALMTLEQNPGGMIAAPATAPNVMEWVCSQHGARLVRTKVDAQSVMAAATNSSCVLAGDGDGGFVFPSFHPGMDALFATGRLAQLLAKRRSNLSDVVDSLPTFHLERVAVPCPWEAKGKVMRILSQQYQGHRERQVDGVRIDQGAGEWVLVLPDADRPVFHVIAESQSGEGSRALLEKFSLLVSNIQR